MGSNSLGKYIKHVRIQKDYSLREVAEKAELSPAQLSKIENGLVSSPKRETLERLAYALNVDKYQIFLLAGKTPNEGFSIENYPSLLEFAGSSHTIRETIENAYMAKSNPSIYESSLELIKKRNADLEDYEAEKVASEMEAAYELTLKRIKSKRKNSENYKY